MDSAQVFYQDVVTANRDPLPWLKSRIIFAVRDFNAQQLKFILCHVDFAILTAIGLHPPDIIHAHPEITIGDIVTSINARSVQEAVQAAMCLLQPVTSKHSGLKMLGTAPVREALRQYYHIPLRMTRDKVVVVDLYAKRGDYYLYDIPGNQNRLVRRSPNGIYILMEGLDDTLCMTTEQAWNRDNHFVVPETKFVISSTAKYLACNSAWKRTLIKIGADYALAHSYARKPHIAFLDVVDVVFSEKHDVVIAYRTGLYSKVSAIHVPTQNLVWQAECAIGFSNNDVRLQHVLTHDDSIFLVYDMGIFVMHMTCHHERQLIYFNRHFNIAKCWIWSVAHGQRVMYVLDLSGKIWRQPLDIDTADTEQSIICVADMASEVIPHEMTFHNLGFLVIIQSQIQSMFHVWNNDSQQMHRVQMNFHAMTDEMTFQTYFGNSAVSGILIP